MSGIGDSQPVRSNQIGIHENLEETVERHIANPWLRPIAEHTREQFLNADVFVRKRAAPVILDSCCGTGDSSRQLAERFPAHTVIGFDKSSSRLGRERDHADHSNMLLIRADMNDLYRLILEKNWNLERHYMFYPNPWPKASHLKRRVHGSPLFPSLCKLGGIFEMRSNWLIYLQEFQEALNIAQYSASITEIKPTIPVSPFERKYAASGHKLYQLTSSLNHASIKVIM